jgi:hypothetical protein
MKSESKKPPAEEEGVRNLDQENSLPESPEDLPFAGLPYSYEGRFLAIFREGQEGFSGDMGEKEPDNAGEAKKLAGEIAYWNSSFSSLAKFKTVPLLAALAVVLLVSPFLVKDLIEGRWNQRASGNAAMELGSLKESIRMTKYLAPVKEGFVEVPLQLVEKKKLVSFSYSKDGEAVPLLAYLTPAGNFGTVVGFSRPCQSEQFHLEGEDIVCDLCLTRWDLETLKGVSGDCLDHPLDKIMHTVRDGKLMIREAGIQEWNRE